LPSIGADISKPLNPFRHWLQYCLIQIVTPILIYISGASFTFKDLPADYTEVVRARLEAGTAGKRKAYPNHCDESLRLA